MLEVLHARPPEQLVLESRHDVEIADGCVDAARSAVSFQVGIHARAEQAVDVERGEGMVEGVN